MATTLEAMTTGVSLSIIIPMFRSASQVERAIASVLRDAKGLRIEIICVDDGSPDDSAEVVERLQKSSPDILLFRHEVNQGQGVARNTGVDHARGDYIVFLDADDELVGGSLPALTSHLQHHPVDLVLVGCEEVRRGRARRLTECSLERRAEAIGVFSVSNHPEALFWPPSPWSKVYRREFLTKWGIRFPGGVFEDIPWSASVTLKASTISVLPHTFYRYVTSGAETSTTTSVSERNLVRIDQVRRIRETNDVTSLGPEIRRHLSALAAIHLIWANRAAEKTLPGNHHQSFFQDSSRELSWWAELAPLDRGLDSRPLMPAATRNHFARALLSGDYPTWLRSMAAYRRQVNLRRWFRPLIPGRF